MKLPCNRSGFALALTLTLMTLIAIVVVAYLSSTRTERNTTSTYAGRMRAQTMADSGLAAAVHVLQANTRYGNYITAMPPAPTASPATIYTEVYRPTNTATGAVIPDDYLRLDNGGGELLVSLASSPSPSNSPGPDPRPSAVAIPTPLASSSPFAIASPNPALTEEVLGPANPTTSATPTPGASYNFNQLVRIGNNNNARLVQPSPSPAPPGALGQWVNVRNTAGDLVGRYAFYMEDESMKVNVNYAGNATSTRTNDLTTATPTPANQIQETDPGAVLPLGSPAPDRLTANSVLSALGTAGARLPTRSTLGLITAWKDMFPDYVHMTTVLSKDDNTTARGWQRLDLNALASGLTSPAAKKPIATRIANWIRDAWTGPPLATLSATQIFNDDRLRQQVAANIVDYIAPAGPPTDMSPPPSPSPALAMSPVPVIGIEKVPYIQAVEVIYQAGSASAGSGPLPTPWPTPGTYTTTIKMKLKFRFINLFEANLVLTDQIGKITVSGVPKITKNNSTLIDVSGQTFTINSTDLKPYNPPNDFNIAAGTDGTSSSGARDFQTDWLATNSPSFTIPQPSASPSDKNPQINPSTLYVSVLGKNSERIDVFGIAIGSQTTGYYYGQSGSSASNYTSQGDFVEEANDSTGSPRSPSPQVASINRTAHLAGPTPASSPFGDPRYRGPATTATLADRWDNDSSRTDATCNPSPSPPGSPGSPCSWLTKPYKVDRIDEYVDKAEMMPRGPAVDWYDDGGDRPLAFIRNGPMLDIGELGNIATCEFPWRTLYLQQPERPANLTTAASDVAARRANTVDYVLVDLFRASGSVTRSGALNINTQFQYLPPSGTVTTSPLESLFVSLPVGAPGVTPSPTPQLLTQATPGAAPSPADRLSTGINQLVSSTTTPASSGTGTNPLPYRVASVSNKRSSLTGETPTADANPPRPYFQIGELAPTLSRLLSASQASDTSSSSSTSKVVYSALRNTPTATTSKNYHKDFEVEQAFREVSNSITTRGNVFRVLYVGEAIKDINHNGQVDSQTEVTAEYLGEAFVERQAVFTQDSSNPDIMRTTDSAYKIIANRVVTQ